MPPPRIPKLPPVMLKSKFPVLKAGSASLVALSDLRPTLLARLLALGGLAPATGTGRFPFDGLRASRLGVIASAAGDESSEAPQRARSPPPPTGPVLSKERRGLAGWRPPAPIGGSSLAAKVLLGRRCGGAAAAGADSVDGRCGGAAAAIAGL